MGKSANIGGFVSVFEKLSSEDSSSRRVSFKM